MAERYAANGDNARWRVVDGEAVIINLVNTHYYSLNRTGTFIWSLLVERAATMDELVSAVAARYGRPADEVAPDVRAVLDDLAREGLVSER
jgi:hypothetical protein